MIGTNNYQTRAVVLSLVLLFQGSSFGSGNEKDTGKKAAQVTLRGAISDSQCAFNVHSNARSHDLMIKQNVPGASDEKSCTLHCVKDMGGNFVLVVKDDVYRLDDQPQAEPFAGKKVKATGTLDPKTHTLHVLKIEEDR